MKIKGETKGVLIALLLIVCASASLGLIRLANENAQEHVINEISKIENVNGTDGHFRTDVYYLVHTDKGTFKIETSGLNAAPFTAGYIHEGDTLKLLTRGLKCEFLGWYPNIIAVLE